MLAYYPLEHIHYLATHGIIPTTFPSFASLFTPSGKRFSPSLNAIEMWSCRFWALYILLQFMHLHEDHRLLKTRERNLRKAKGTGLSVAEKEQLRQSWDAYWNEVLVNAGYLPLTIHWCVRMSILVGDQAIVSQLLIYFVLLYKHWY
jgi:hypothetical protein